LIATGLAGCADESPTAMAPLCTGHASVMQGIRGIAASADDVAPSTGWRPLANLTFAAVHEGVTIGTTTSDRGGYFHLELPVGTYQFQHDLTSVEVSIDDGSVVQVEFEAPFLALLVVRTDPGPVDATTCE
jgi:hypothetical protein